MHIINTTIQYLLDLYLPSLSIGCGKGRELILFTI